jgi:class 3 adenylate cyclase
MQDIGWAVAMWRPRDQVLSEYIRVRQQIAAVAAGTLLLALIAGFIAARAVTRPVLEITAQARRIGKREWSELAPPSARADELGELGRSIVTMANDLRQGEIEALREAKLRGDLSRFMSKELVDAIVRGEHPLALGGTRMNVSVVFADVVAFTPLAESRPAEAVVAILNELFSVLSEVVFRHGGTVDKFIGDCLMAVWGAPEPHPDHAVRALSAAEDMMRFLETAAAQWRKKYGVEIRLGVGVNSGEAIVGNIGSDKRMEYTVIGDVVNVAARLEAIAAPNQVLVSAATKEMVGDAFSMRLLGERALSGRKQTTQVYELETG